MTTGGTIRTQSMPHPIHIIQSNRATYLHLPQLKNNKQQQQQQQKQQQPASAINTLQVHAKGNKLNHNGCCHAGDTLEIARELSYMLNLN